LFGDAVSEGCWSDGNARRGRAVYGRCSDTEGVNNEVSVMKNGVLMGRLRQAEWLIAVLAAALLLGGCATSLESDSMPGVNLSGLKSFYVVKLPQDGRGIERLISERLVAMGKLSSYGPAPKPPSPVDAVVTYQDRWMWDITMYMLELSIQIRDPKNDVQLASGHSMRTSLVRKSPEEMIAEVLDKIFQTTVSPTGGK
jgi:hypothetical protein